MGRRNVVDTLSGVGDVAPTPDRVRGRLYGARRRTMARAMPSASSQARSKSDVPPV